jgi:hypothetical protein
MPANGGDSGIAAAMASIVVWANGRDCSNGHNPMRDFA